MDSSQCNKFKFVLGFLVSAGSLERHITCMWDIPEGSINEFNSFQEFLLLLNSTFILFRFFRLTLEGNRNWRLKFTFPTKSLNCFTGVIELTWVSPHHLGLTKELKQKLQVFINKCLGKIRRLWWPKRIRNEELWRQEGQRPIEEEIRKRTWRWIGKTLRRPDKQVAKTTL